MKMVFSQPMYGYVLVYVIYVIHYRYLLKITTAMNFGQFSQSKSPLQGIGDGGFRKKLRFSLATSDTLLWSKQMGVSIVMGVPQS